MRYSILLLARMLLTPFKKLLGVIGFPFAYLFRNKVFRSVHAYTENRWEIEKVLQRNRGWKLLVWLFLDDSIYSDFRKDYHPYEHRSKLVDWLCQYTSVSVCNFLKSWYWSGWRNSTNNLSHLLAYQLGQFIQTKFTYQTKHITYEIREFEHGFRPYLEIHIGKCTVNVGWLKSGKFEGLKLRCGE